MDKTFEIFNLEQELRVELFVSSDENIDTSLKLNKTVILNKNNKIIGLNLTYCNVDKLDSLIKFRDLEYLILQDNQIFELKKINNFKKLKFLDLGSNKIENIEPLSQLEKLEHLYLDNNHISFIPKFNSKEIKSLVLENNIIESIENLKYLENLNLLNLNNNLIKDIETIRFLKKIKYISISSNDLVDVSFLKEFDSLISLNISKNKIIDISAISNLKVSKDLFIGENLIFDISPLYYSLKRKNIGFMNAFGNPIIYPPFEIVQRGDDFVIEWFENIINAVIDKIYINKRSKNPTLDIGYMGLTDLSMVPELFALDHLEELIISNEWAEYDNDKEEWEPKYSDNEYLKNNIINIPKEVSKLKNLKKIIAGGDWNQEKDWNRWRINDFSNIMMLDKIEYINLSNNQINNINLTKNLSNLKTLHLNNNFISKISITRSKNIQYLFLSNNKIEKLDFLKNSTKLLAVDLHSNCITNLAPIKDLIKQIGIQDNKWLFDTISISNNPLKNPGIEVVQRGVDAVLRTIDSNFGVKKYVNNQVKLILVGNSEVGKTTLTKYLEKDKNYKEKHPFTLWMDEVIINFKGKEIRIFDFGGHEFFHDTHHVFFTKNTLYIVLWDKNSNKFSYRELKQSNSEGNIVENYTYDYPLNYWLDSIKYFVKDKEIENFSDDLKNNIKEIDNENNYKARAIVIQNKVEENSDLVFLNNKKLKKRYPFIHNINSVDIHNDNNVFFIDKGLEDLIKTQKTVGSEYPYYYKNVLDNIVKFKSFNGKNVINFDEFKKLCQGFIRKTTSNNEILDIAYFLKNLGVILFTNDENTFYLNVKKVSEEISKIYSGLNLEKGIFTYEKLEEKQIENCEEILKFMKDFNMIFELKYEKNNGVNVDIKLVAPLFLPDNPSKLVKLLLENKYLPFRRIKYNGFMHKGVILHIFSEYSNKIVTEDLDKNSYYWKNGLIIKDNGNVVLIKFFIGEEKKEDEEKKEGEKRKDSYIDIIPLKSDCNEQFLSNIVLKILEINKINNYDVDEMVSADGENFISLKILHKNEESKNEVFLYKEDKKYYKLYDFKKYLKNKNSGMKKVFLSYSRQNLNYKESLKTHLSILERYGLLKAWSCDQIVAGKWNQQIQKELEESDIIIYMVSADFMSSNYIMEDEVKKGIELVKKNPEKKIICVLVGVCQWSNWSALEEVYNQSKDLQGSFSTSDLSQFQFLPYHQYKNEKGEAIREEIVALEKWGRHPYDVVNEAYNQIVSRVFNEIAN